MTRAHLFPSRLFVVLLLFLTSGNAGAAGIQTPHVEVELLSEQQTIRAGQAFSLALRLKMEEHWHTYWSNPGDSGLATSIDWDLPAGFRAGTIQWPVPSAIPFSDLVNYGYEGEIYLLIDITPPADLSPNSTVHLKARADWLVCQEVCTPGDADLELRLPTGSTAIIDPALTGVFEKARRLLPQTSMIKKATARVDAGKLMLELETPPMTFSRATFFPHAELLISASGEQKIVAIPGGYRLALPLAANALVDSGEHVSGILRLDEQGLEIRADWASSAAGRPEVIQPGLLLGIFFGFLGGLILNLMPCVFPVLGLKIMGFVNQAGASRRHTALHGLVFVAGILLSFWTLCGILLFLRAGGEQIGWGFQLQSPAFVYGLCVVLLLFGLNMSGLFEVGVSVVGVGSGLASRPKLSGAFFSGVLATVVATPCAAPFLATALGAALTLPALPSLLLFTSIAVGLGTPYLLLSLFPGLIRWLPKPGAWMESFKQAMAFLLYGAAIFLVWVLEGQVDESTFLRILFSLVLISLAAWIYGRWTRPGQDTPVRFRAAIASATILVLGLSYGYPVTDSAEFPLWEPWSAERVEELRREKRIIYVDFTARWCATCLTNKKVVFSSEDVKDRFRELKVVALKADWTQKDSSITRELATWGRSAVPFNLIYRPDQNEAEVLPELLTPGRVLDRLPKRTTP